MPTPAPLSPDVLHAAIVQALNDGTLSTPAAPPDKPRSHTPIHLELAGMNAAQLMDALTTIAALGRNGTAEGNSGIYGSHPSAGRILATKAAGMLPVTLLLDRLYTHHPKAAQITAGGIAALGAGLALHNSHMGK